jgi:hypothetical protein
VKRKKSVAVAIRAAGHVLVVQRPADDEELPDEWGLPAASLHDAESWEEAVVRAGREKLGVALEVGAELRRGSLERESYTLEMRLYEAGIAAGSPVVPQPDRTVTQYQQWKWGTAEDLLPAADRRSLCCRLYLELED